MWAVLDRVPFSLKMHRCQVSPHRLSCRTSLEPLEKEALVHGLDPVCVEVRRLLSNQSSDLSYTFAYVAVRVLQGHGSRGGGLA